MKRTKENNAALIARIKLMTQDNTTYRYDKDFDDGTPRDEKVIAFAMLVTQLMQLRSIADTFGSVTREEIQAMIDAAMDANDIVEKHTAMGGVVFERHTCGFGCSPSNLCPMCMDAKYGK
jgi:hypothetical protein